MNKIKIIVVVLILTVVIVSILFAQNAPRGVERWEYTEISPSLTGANELGQQGWEFILIRGNGQWIFKRPLR